MSRFDGSSSNDKSNRLQLHNCGLICSTGERLWTLPLTSVTGLAASMAFAPWRLPSTSSSIYHLRFTIYHFFHSRLTIHDLPESSALSTQHSALSTHAGCLLIAICCLLLTRYASRLERRVPAPQRQRRRQTRKTTSYCVQTNPASQTTQHRGRGHGVAIGRFHHRT